MHKHGQVALCEALHLLDSPEGGRDTHPLHLYGWDGHRLIWSNVDKVFSAFLESQTIPTSRVASTMSSTSRAGAPYPMHFDIYINIYRERDIYT